jgi:hypothetical protein
MCRAARLADAVGDQLSNVHSCQAVAGGYDQLISDSCLSATGHGQLKFSSVELLQAVNN